MSKKHNYDQIVYFLQGGGALGTYQSGVCEALLDSDFSPDWLVGTSIGAINAGIIAGNKPEDRIEKMKEFWDIVAPPVPFMFPEIDTPWLKTYRNFFGAQCSVLLGQPGFFKPKWFSPWLEISATPDQLSYYDTSELHQTLKKVIDFKRINQGKTRLSLGAVNVRTGEAVRFDNTRQKIGPEHIMASAALPPGFPAIKIGKEYYWDGGMLSNTPFSAILEEKIAQKLLCFVVNLYSFPEHLPTSMWDIMNTAKELEYASRHKVILQHFCELHYFQQVINFLGKTDKNNKTLKAALKTIAEAGHPTSVKVLRFHYKDCPTDLYSKDFNFLPQVLREHWHAGFKDAHRALADQSWLDLPEEPKPVIHEF